MTSVKINVVHNKESKRFRWFKGTPETQIIKDIRAQFALDPEAELDFFDEDDDSVRLN